MRDYNRNLRAGRCLVCVYFISWAMDIAVSAYSPPSKKMAGYHSISRKYGVFGISLILANTPFFLHFLTFSGFSVSPNSILPVATAMSQVAWLQQLCSCFCQGAILQIIIPIAASFSRRTPPVWLHRYPAADLVLHELICRGLRRRWGWAGVAAGVAFGAAF